MLPRSSPSGDRLLALWNASARCRKSKEGLANRDALIDQLSPVIECCRAVSSNPTRSAPPSKMWYASCAARRMQRFDEVASVTGWAASYRFVASSRDLEEKLGLTLASAKEERAGFIASPRRERMKSPTQRCFGSPALWRARSLRSRCNDARKYPAFATQDRPR